MGNKNSVDEQYYLNENNIFKKIENSKQYQIKSEKAESIEEKLRDSLDKQNKIRLRDCIDAHHDKAIVMLKESFKYGFSLATNLILESLNNNNEKANE